jgi:hypothetical protein
MAAERSADFESVCGSRVTISCASGGGGLVCAKTAGRQTREEANIPKSRVVFRIKAPKVD